MFVATINVITKHYADSSNKSKRGDRENCSLANSTMIHTIVVYLGYIYTCHYIDSFGQGIEKFTINSY